MPNHRLILGGMVRSVLTDVATPPPPPPPATQALLGMRSPEAEFDARRAEVEATGGRVECTRIFFGNNQAWTHSGHRAFIDRMIAEDVYPLISFKPDGLTWGQYASGAGDAQANAAAAWLADLGSEAFVAFHHEPFASGHPPASDGPGTTTDWVNANKRLLPIFASAGPHIKVGVIVNGWMWNSNSQGQTDAEIDTVLPASLRNICDVVAADFYQNTAGAETAGAKMQNFRAWASRKGVTAGGAGEFSGQDAAGMHSAPNVAKPDPFWQWLSVFNSNTGALGDYLTGERLEAFQQDLRTWRA